MEITLSVSESTIGLISLCLLDTIIEIPKEYFMQRGTIKDRIGMNLTEAEDIKKRCQEYTKELYKKDLHDQDNHNGVITHLEPDILECKVKSLSHVQLLATPWTAAHQAPPSMGFSIHRRNVQKRSS